MLRLLKVVAGLYRNWRFVEESEPEAETGARAESPRSELDRLRLAIAREEGRLEDFRRNHCSDFVRQCEDTIRFLRSRLHALEL